MADKDTAMKILRTLEKAYPDAPPTYLEFSNPFEMLIATILSAHTTDASVNEVTPTLFEKYPDPASLASAEKEEVIETIRLAGLYNRKSDYIMKTAREIVERFNGSVPGSLEDLVSFPGVSRKTANVVLSVAFNKNEGVVVDTHVMRVTVRLGLSEHDKKPTKIEKDLMGLYPENLWDDYARVIGAHGRQTCTARNPKCPECSVSKLCPSVQL
ncbi:endonuclease III [Candidatus Thorarchaeota archaeon]|nr:MAG: endonuclease III [Candidatus Thorarchaeota archaeon]